MDWSLAHVTGHHANFRDLDGRAGHANDRQQKFHHPAT